MDHTIPEDTPVSVVNVGERPFKDDYGNRTFIIEPGQKRLVPYFAAVYWFGDPRSTNIGPPDSRETQYRTLEVDRLGVKYGLHGAPMYSDGEYIHTVDDTTVDYIAGRHPNLPRVEVYDVTDQRLITVLDDPEGTHGAPSAQTSADTATMTEAIASLQQQVMKLSNQLLMTDPDAAQALLAPTIGLAPRPADEDPITAAAITASLDADTRDPVADPTDPAQRAGDDLPPKERALRDARAAKRKVT